MLEVFFIGGNLTEICLYFHLYVSKKMEVGQL